MNFRNYKIGTRLVAGFGVVMGLLIISLIASNLSSTHDREELISSFNDSNSKVILAVKMKAALLDEGIAIRNIGLLSEVSDMQREEGKAKLKRKEFSDARELLVAAGLSVEEKKSLQKLVLMRKP